MHFPLFKTPYKPGQDARVFNGRLIFPDGKCLGAEFFWFFFFGKKKNRYA
jgi:hypothetical protein